MANKIEEIKRVKDGLDVLQDIMRYASTGAEMDPDDLERMKWYGIFYRRQTPGFFMMRLRIPNGILTSRQIAGIGEISNRFGRGQVDITTRQNLQLRWLQIQDIPEVFAILAEIGIEHRQSGMDNIRNITGCPMAGLDPYELFDASQVAVDVQRAIVGMRDFSNLPRKFNISISGCRHDCAASQIHDLSFTPSRKGDAIGFNVKVGGALGGRMPRFGVDLDAFVTPAQAPDFARAVLGLFRDEGSRESRQTARLKFLLEEWGVERFRDGLEARLGHIERAGEDLVESFAGDHIGVAQQKQANLRAIGLHVPVGRIEADELMEFGRLAEVYGSGELRLTNDQNILVVNVPAQVEASFLKEPLLQKYSAEPASWARRTVSCTGKDFCHFALIDTKARAVEFAQAMEDALPLEFAPRIHWSGCPHACGQHQIGDVGLLASRVRVGNEIVDAADVYLGGQLGGDARLGVKVLDAVPLTDLPQQLISLLKSHAHSDLTGALKTHISHAVALGAEQTEGELIGPA